MDVSKKLEFILKQNEKNRLSHAFLIETNNIDRCLDEVKKIIKIINCQHNYKLDCKENCNLCNLIDKNNLPSLVIIEPDGMSIKKEQVLFLEEKFSKKPVYSRYNSYIILNAEKMNLASSNTILKFLEEPEPNIVGFFITTSLDNIIPTIKSRCEITRVYYDDANNLDSEWVNDVISFYNLVLNDDDILSIKKSFLDKYTDRTEIYKVFQYLYTFIFDKYINSFKNGVDNGIIKGQLDLIIKSLRYINSNVNIELLLDSFIIEMRRLNG